MSVKKWYRKSNSGKTGITMWGGWKTGNTSGALDTEIVIVKQALLEISVALQNADASSFTDEYLVGSQGTHKNIYANGLNRLKLHVKAYLNAKSDNSILYVAKQTFMSLASSPGYNTEGLILESNLRKSNTIIIQQGFILTYPVGSVNKKLTTWGRHKTVLHELTHSLLRTKDVWFHGGVYGTTSQYANDAVTTRQETKDLASSAVTGCNGEPMCYHNAENWTNAIAGCHPSNGGKADQEIVN
jgi:hypothetical protein